jgi:hypothetical protein
VYILLVSSLHDIVNVLLASLVIKWYLSPIYSHYNTAVEVRTKLDYVIGASGQCTPTNTQCHKFFFVYVLFERGWTSVCCHCCICPHYSRNFLLHLFFSKNYLFLIKYALTYAVQHSQVLEVTIHKKIPGMCPLFLKFPTYTNF